MQVPLLIALYLLFPAIAIYLCYRFPVMNKIGVVIFCYAAGCSGPAGIPPYFNMERAAVISPSTAPPLVF